MDHQPFLCLDDPLCPTSDSTYVCTDYMCAYFCKHNQKPSVAVRVYEDTLDVIAEATPDQPRYYSTDLDGKEHWGATSTVCFREFWNILMAIKFLLCQVWNEFVSGI